MSSRFTSLHVQIAMFPCRAYETWKDSRWDKAQVNGLSGVVKEAENKEKLPASVPQNHTVTAFLSSFKNSSAPVFDYRF